MSGDEINKIVFDFGVPIRWNSAFDDQSHPLIKIIENRVATSLRLFDPEFDIGLVWQNFFPETIQGIRIKNWILDRTWYRPRDIVRLLTICRDFNKEAITFSQNAFEQTARDYSDSCWVEISEELRASYTSEDVEAIKTLFTGLPNSPKSFVEIEEFCLRKSQSHPDVKRLFDGRTTQSIFHDFFRVGIIGNEHKLRSGGPKKYLHNWYFRNGDNLLFDKDISVHRGLRHTFRMIAS